MAKILVVDDDKALAEIVCDSLRFETHLVEHAATALDALTRLSVSGYDLVILDWDLPDGTGIEICRKIRAQNDATPIIMLTGKSAKADKLTGLDSGADDYVVKPFDMDELTARVRSVLRRISNATSNKLTVGDLTLDSNEHRVCIQSQEIRLLPKEFALLEFLMRHPGRVFSLEALLQRVWSSESDATEEAIKSCIKRLKKKLEDGAAQTTLENVPRVGYRLKIGS